MKRVVRRATADGDIRKAIRYYPENASQNTALYFIDALEDAFQHIRDYPQAGSPRYAHDLELPGLRFWLCDRFPYLIFYVETANAIEVWRVLHSHQDIPETLRGNDQGLSD